MAALPIFPYVPDNAGRAAPPAQPAAAPPQADLSMLLGGTPGPAGPQAPPVDETVRQIMTQIGQASSMLEDMGRQFPWANEEGRAAASALVQYGMAIVRGLSGPGSEPQAPTVLG